MLRLGTVAVALMLAACAKPAVTGSGPDSVTIGYDPLLNTRQEIAAEARASCMRFDKPEARYVSTSRPTPWGMRYDTFACEGDVSP